VDHAEGEGFVIDAGEDEDWEVAVVGEEALEGIEALGIGEAEIEEDEIDIVAVDGLLGIGEAGDLADQLELVAVIGKQFRDEPHVAWIILDEEDFKRVRGYRGTGCHHWR
jgi:hypothetical protein